MISNTDISRQMISETGIPRNKERIISEISKSRNFRKQILQHQREESYNTSISHFKPRQHSSLTLSAVPNHKSHLLR
jgi:SLT domain-containing protein